MTLYQPVSTDSVLEKFCVCCQCSKPLDQFEWLPRQGKFHDKCHGCTRQRVLRACSEEEQGFHF